jgi:lysophospholipase L1-like esterase
MLNRARLMTKRGEFDTLATGPTYETPSYDNEGGTGNRSGWITVTPSASLGTLAANLKQKLVNGNTADGEIVCDDAPIANSYFDFIFPHKVFVDEIKLYQSLTPASVQGTWKPQIDIENDGNLVDAGTAQNLGGGATSTLTVTHTVPFKRLRLLGMSGTMNANGYTFWDEFELKISNPVDQFRTVLILGDSKSAGTVYPSYMFTLLNAATGKSWRESLPRLATGGWGIADLQTSVVANIASVTPSPQYAIINIGVNDGSPAISENDYKTYMQSILTLVHDQFPLCPIYLTRIWLRLGGDFPGNIATWIADLVALNSFAHLGADERIYLENSDDGVTYTSDGIHPTDPEGYQLMSQKAGEVMGLL